jgi:type III secretory pathway component EscS
VYCLLPVSLAVYEVELPPSVKRLLSFFSVVVSFGFGSTNALFECIGLRGYREMLTLYMVAPLAIAAAIVGVAICRMRARREGLVEGTATRLLQLVFLAYPLVATKAFEAFSCYDFTERSFLKADVAIVCDSPEHADVQALAWGAIGLYPVG